MKIKIVKETENKHSDVVTCVGWTGNNELFSCGDDRKILRWSHDGEHLGPVSTTLFDAPTAKSGANSNATTTEPVYVTDLHWLPSSSGKIGGGGAGASGETFAIGGTDGKYYLLSKNGKVEKAVEAHKGALLALKWNYEGSALVTAGEDGAAKIWSRSGMLRSVLVQIGYPVYSVAWSPNNDSILFTNGRNLIIKPLQPAQKPTTWKAHEGVILKVDWNLVNNLIVSGGEDRRYKVWNSYGQCLYTSAPHDHPITSISWSISGDVFAVGSYNLVRVCDKLGWSYAMSRPQAGSITNISWTPDGTQFACAGGNGSVVFGHVIGKRMEWKHLEVTLLDDYHVRVQDTARSITENLDFRDRIVKSSIGFSHLIIATASQCYVYSEKNWNTPSVIDITNNGRVITIQQCSDSFLIVDTCNGVQIYTYDGRLVSSPKYPGLRPELLTPNAIGLSSDVLAIKDHTDEKMVYLFEISSGRQLLEQPLKHTADILEVSINPGTTSSTGRQLVVLDKNRELWITPALKPNFKKLGTMVDTFSWNEEVDMIAAMVDGKFVVWYYPNVVFVDEDIIGYSKFEKDGSQFGRNAQIVNFHGTQCTLRRSDGALVTIRGMSPFPILLHEQIRRKQWEEAIRLCRYAKSKDLWACLAAMAIHGQDLNTAEVAYASIDEVQKVHYVCYIKEIPSNEGRTAELALMRRQPREAEQILLAAGLVFRAIRMWIQLFNWDRAFELAVKYKTHVDTVLMYRDKYLKRMGMPETNPKFAQYAEGIEIDAEKIAAKIQMEEENERTRNRGR